MPPLDSWPHPLPRGKDYSGFMGASNSSEREEDDSSGQDVLDVLQQLAGDLGVRVEMSVEEEEDGEGGSSGVGQRAPGRASSGGDNEMGEGEGGEEEESGDEGFEADRATVQLLARLFGGRS